MSLYADNLLLYIVDPTVKLTYILDILLGLGEIFGYKLNKICHFMQLPKLAHFIPEHLKSRTDSTYLLKKLLRAFSSGHAFLDLLDYLT